MCHRVAPTRIDAPVLPALSVLATSQRTTLRPATLYAQARIQTPLPSPCLPNLASTPDRLPMCFCFYRATRPRIWCAAAPIPSCISTPECGPLVAPGTTQCRVHCSQETNGIHAVPQRRFVLVAATHPLITGTPTPHSHPSETLSLPCARDTPPCVCVLLSSHPRERLGAPDGGHHPDAGAVRCRTSNPRLARSDAFLSCVVRVACASRRTQTCQGPPTRPLTLRMRLRSLYILCQS